MMQDFINVFIMNFHNSIIIQPNFSLLSVFVFCKNILVISQFHPFFFFRKTFPKIIDTNDISSPNMGESDGLMRCPNDHRCTLRSTRSPGCVSSLHIPYSLDLRLSYEKRSKTAHSVILDFPVSLQKPGHFHGSLICASQLLQCNRTWRIFQLSSKQLRTLSIALYLQVRSSSIQQFTVLGIRFLNFVVGN